MVAGGGSMTDYAWLFALSIVVGTAMLTASWMTWWLARRYVRRIRHRLFAHIPPSRWPQVDYRVGKSVRPRDYE
jgi:hypothetical protein